MCGHNVHKLMFCPACGGRYVDYERKYRMWRDSQGYWHVQRNSVRLAQLADQRPRGSRFVGATSDRAMNMICRHIKRYGMRD